MRDSSCGMGLPGGMPIFRNPLEVDGGILDAPCDRRDMEELVLGINNSFLFPEPMSEEELAGTVNGLRIHLRGNLPLPDEGGETEEDLERELALAHPAGIPEDAVPAQP